MFLPGARCWGSSSEHDSPRPLLLTVYWERQSLTRQFHIQFSAIMSWAMRDSNGVSSFILGDQERPF